MLRRFSPRSILLGLVLVGAMATTALFAIGIAQAVGGVVFPLDVALFLAPRAEAAAPMPPGLPRKPSMIPQVTVEPKAPIDLDRPLEVCAFGGRLAIAAVDPDESARSIAVVEIGDGHALLREGSPLAGHAVAAIGRDRVYFRGASSFCFVGTSKNAKLVQPPPETKPMPPGMEKLVQKIDDRTVRIERALRDKLIENSGDLMKAVRIEPVQEGGRTLGIRMVMVRPDSIIHLLGIRTGDVLQSVNGFEVGSAEKLLEAYARLGSAPQLEVAILRAGKPTTLSIEVR